MIERESKLLAPWERPKVLKSRWQTLTALQLTVVMLLGSLAPPGTCHRHADGDVVHSHRHGHHDHGRGDHGSDYHQTSTERVARAAEPHLHLAFAVFNVTLPVREDDSESTSHKSDPALYPMRLVDDCVPRVDGFTVLGHLDAPSLRATVATKDRMRRPAAQPAASIPLCDTARHERSGVQLF